MKHVSKSLIRMGFGVFSRTGIHRWMRPLFAGAGVIFTLHHVRPDRGATFSPNHHLEITPQFLRSVIKDLRAENIDLVSLDEARRRLTECDFSRRFAAFTFDDGYRDNRDHALPVMRELGVPMTVFVASHFADGIGRPWWLALEQVIAHNSRIAVTLDDAEEEFDLSTTEGKYLAFGKVHDWVRAQADDRYASSVIDELCARNGVDPASITRALCMTWQELRAFAQDPLVTIGAHTLSHCNLAKRDAAEASQEIAVSRADIEAALDRDVAYLAYPYGDRSAANTREFDLARDLGFKAAVTTRAGMLFPEHADHLTALPRVSINGNYQFPHFISVMTSGAPTALWNRFRRLNVA